MAIRAWLASLVASIAVSAAALSASFSVSAIMRSSCGAIVRNLERIRYYDEALTGSARSARSCTASERPWK